MTECRTADLTVASLEPDMMTFSSYCRHRTEPVWPCSTCTHSRLSRSQIYKQQIQHSNCQHWTIIANNCQNIFDQISQPESCHVHLLLPKNRNISDCVCIAFICM